MSDIIAFKQLWTELKLDPRGPRERLRSAAHIPNLQCCLGIASH